MRQRWSLLFLVILSVNLPVLGAEEKPKAAVYGFPAEVGGQPSEAKEILDQFEAQTITGDDAVKQLADLTTSSLRFVGSHKGQIVRIYCFYREEAPDPATGRFRTIALKIDEKRRDPLVADQFRTLVKLVDAFGQPAGAGEMKFERFQYKLKLERATLDITAQLTLEPKDNPIAAAGQPHWLVIFDFTNGGGKTNADPTTATVLTGRREPWSISADVPIASLNDVEVDDEFSNVELKETPETFYAGFNWAPFGDAIKPPETLMQALTIKALLKASRRPSDSFGLGIGLRSGFFANHPSMSKLPFVQIFDTLSPYVAYTRTRVEEEQKDADGNTTKVHFKRNDWVVGISLDIERALDFVKKAGDGDEEKKE